MTPTKIHKAKILKTKNIKPLIAALFATAFAIFSAPQVTAQTPAQSTAQNTTQNTAQNTAQPGTILQLVGQGKFDEARAALAATPHALIDRLFLEAQIFLALGQLPEAAATFRAMLAEAPGLIPVRQTLADILFQLEDYSGARFHFERLVEIDPRPEAREAYARAIARIRREEPAGVSAILTFTPSTNINRGSANETFGNGSITSQEKSGIGITVGGNGFYKLDAGENAVVNARASVQKTFYSEDEFDQTSVQASLSYIHTAPDAESLATFSTSRVLRNPDIGNDHYRTYSLRTQTRRALKGANILTFGSTATYTDYDSSSGPSGPSVTTDLALQSQITPSFSANFSLNATRAMPQNDYQRYSGWGLGMGGSTSWKGGWSTYLGIEGGFRKYDGVFPLTSLKREDSFIALRGSVLNSTIVLRGFSPRVNCFAQANGSNISLYDYNVVECGLQFTRGF